jgi:5S rRNA maturation endonuclease (ribonuclease M5)
MNKENLLVILDQMISELREVNNALPIIVEGDRDEQSLRNLVFTGTILKLNIGKSVFNFCEDLTRYEEVIILVDWDRKGRELRDRLKNALTANGIIPNDSYWLGLRHLCGGEIQEVEYLYTYFENLKLKVSSQTK